MSNVYTTIAAGGSATADRVAPLAGAINDTALGGITSGELVQCDMGYSNPANLFRQPAEMILARAPHHPESLRTVFTHDPNNEDSEAQLVETFGYRGVVQRELAKAIDRSATIAGIIVDYEERPRTIGQPVRFDAGRRRFTNAEIDLGARCVAVSRSELYAITGTPRRVGFWNTPIDPLHPDMDWDHIRDLHAATKPEFALLNAYRYFDTPKENYEHLMTAASVMHRELPGVPIIAALMPSTDGRAFTPTPPVALLHKLYAIQSAGIGTLVWVNAAWTTSDTNTESIIDFAEIVGSYLGRHR